MADQQTERYQPLALVAVILGTLLLFAIFFLGFLVAPLAILTIFYVGFAATDRSKTSGGGGPPPPAEEPIEPIGEEFAGNQDYLDPNGTQQDPYAADPYAQDPYAADPYAPDPYGQQGR